MKCRPPGTGYLLYTPTVRRGRSDEAPPGDRADGTSPTPPPRTGRATPPSEPPARRGGDVMMRTTSLTLLTIAISSLAACATKQQESYREPSRDTRVVVQVPPSNNT